MTTTGPVETSLPQCPTHPQYFIAPGGVCPMCSWDPVAQVETVETVSAELMEIEKFEGSDVVEWEMRLPATSIESERSFKRGSVIRLAVEVRVRNVGYVERKDGSLIRTHQATIEDVSVISAFDPSESRENVSGGLSGTTPDEPDPAEEGTTPDPLAGLTTGRTQDEWPPREQATA